MEAGAGSEAMIYRDEFAFSKHFLQMSREERQRVFEHACLNPVNQDDARIVSETMAGIRANPQDEKNQRQLLTTLYEVWNRTLEELETQYPAQTPDQGATLLDGDVIAVVIGGKHMQQGLLGVGDALVSSLLTQSNPNLHVMSYARNDIDEDLAQPQHYRHFTDLASLMECVAKKEASTKVVFFFTIALTGNNGENIANEEIVSNFVTECRESGLLHDRNVKVVQTGTYHASAREAGHEDNLADNYGLLDYAASKVMQTMLLAEAIHESDATVRASAGYRLLEEQKAAVQITLNAIREHWAAHPDDAAARACPKAVQEKNDDLVSALSVAAQVLYEDTSGPTSIVCLLQEISNRFEVVKLPYCLSNTAIYKRLFVFNSRINGGDAWKFFLSCSTKRFRIVMTPNRAADWHLAFARELLAHDCCKSRNFVESASKRQKVRKLSSNM